MPCTNTRTQMAISLSSGIPLFLPCNEHCPTDFSRNFRLADLVTIMNGVCGSFSVFSSARYLISNDPDYLWSAFAFPLAGLMFDFLDGKVARWRKSSSLLGQELDSLADLVSTGSATTKEFSSLTIDRFRSVLHRHYSHSSADSGHI